NRNSVIIAWAKWLHLPCWLTWRVDLPQLGQGRMVWSVVIVSEKRVLKVTRIFSYFEPFTDYFPRFLRPSPTSNKNAPRIKVLAAMSRNCCVSYSSSFRSLAVLSSFWYDSSFLALISSSLADDNEFFTYSSPAWIPAAYPAS